MPATTEPSPDALLDRLPAELRAMLAEAARLAAGQGARLYLVGGVVRDMLLGLPAERDVDLAVEGDVSALAPALAEALGGAVTAAHAPFGTATLEAGGRTIDLARARAEEYPHPAALPVVRPAPIEVDLIRRDFSANAIALGLEGGGGVLRAAALLDPFGGRADLRAGLLRLLHPLSLRDDPTRLLRGLRQAARHGMRPEPASAAQIEAALAAGYLGLLSAERVQGELCLALAEPRPDAILRLADEWGVTAQVAPGLAWGPELAARAGRLAASPDAGRPPLWLGLLTYGLEEGARSALAARYRLPAHAAALLRDVGKARALAAQLAAAPAPSAIDRLLRPLSPDAAAVLHYAEPGPAGAAAARYLRELRPLAAPLDGDDLRRLGVAPGPAMGRLLERLRAATLDGAVTGREAAEGWVRRELEAGRTTT